MNMEDNKVTPIEEIQGFTEAITKAAADFMDKLAAEELQAQSGIPVGELMDELWLDAEKPYCPEMDKWK